MRDSDRWVTPRVVVAGLAGGVLVVIAAIGAVTYLSAIHVDPAPMLKLAGVLAGGASGLLSLILQLAQRRTVAKIERNTGAAGYPPAGDDGDQGDQGDDVGPATAIGIDGDPWARAFLPPVPPADATRPRRRGGGEPAR